MGFQPYATLAYGFPLSPDWGFDDRINAELNGDDGPPAGSLAALYYHGTEDGGCTLLPFAHTNDPRWFIAVVRSELRVPLAEPGRVAANVPEGWRGLIVDFSIKYGLGHTEPDWWLLASYQ